MKLLRTQDLVVPCHCEASRTCAGQDRPFAQKRCSTRSIIVSVEFTSFVRLVGVLDIDDDSCLEVNQTIC
ncbi:hypothetical protein C2U69_34525 [Cupriavidus pinatubonensis]|nr:hypothetical protein C2U69_34525 [Cupriavidus pinatubonensis]